MRKTEYFLIFLSIVFASCRSEPCHILLPELYEQDQHWISYSYDQPAPFADSDGTIDSLYAPPSIYFLPTREEAMFKMKIADTCFKVGGYGVTFSLYLDSVRIGFNIMKDPDKLFLPRLVHN